jgi:hypothetical protein
VVVVVTLLVGAVLPAPEDAGAEARKRAVTPRAREADENQAR